jgi:hypothetical protein
MAEKYFLSEPTAKKLQTLLNSGGEYFSGEGEYGGAARELDVPVYFRLTVPFFPCQSASAVEARLVTPDCAYFDTVQGGLKATIYDINQAVRRHNVSLQYSADDPLPMGTVVQAIQENTSEGLTPGRSDYGCWRLVSVMGCDCGSESQSSSEPSSEPSSGSYSETSSSKPSSSEPPSSSSWHPPSSSWQPSSSWNPPSYSSSSWSKSSGSVPSGSGPSGSSGSGPSGSSGSGPSGSSGSGPSGSGGGSSKDTAIVPASWTGTGYAALFVAEMPDVRFDEVMSYTGGQESTRVPVDPRFLEVCEVDTMAVVSACPDEPVVIGASFCDGHVELLFAEQRPEKLVTVTMRLSAIRKGFRNDRFTPRSERQFICNERHINSAYPAE